MSKNKEKTTKYAEKLKEYDEKLENVSNFSTIATLSKEEHKMLVEGYKNFNFFESNEFKEMEVCDLEDFLSLERNDGGTTN